MTVEEVEIETFSKKGYGVGRIGAKKVEVAHSALKDRLEVEFVKRRGKGRLLKILTPSPDRVVPKCSHASICGGCTWQQIDYKAQCRYKEERLEELFRDLLSSSSTHLYPLIPCDTPWEYRNKMEFSFSENRAGTKFLGLMIAHANSYVFNVESCHLAKPWVSKVLKEVYAFWSLSSIKAYDPPTNTGSLISLTVREGVRTSQKMIILTVSGNPEFALARSEVEAFKEAVKKAVGEEGVSIFINVRQIAKGVETQIYEMHLAGPAYIEEELHLEIQGEMRVFTFAISPSSFFQPNTLQAEKLYTRGLNLLSVSGKEVVFDLYAGTGTLGMAIAPFVHKVITIEQNPYAVFDALLNAEKNGLTNLSIYKGDVGKVLTDLKEQNLLVNPDIVIVDPPRAGLDEGAISHLVTLAPKTILYISCNPTTQVENCKTLLTHGYQLKILQPVDQFPHTVHLENIAILERV